MPRVRRRYGRQWTRTISRPWGVPMTHAAIVGWGKCLPPSILTNQDLATFLPTDDEWITTRTGMKERRISHVPGIELAITAARRAIACAGHARRGYRARHLRQLQQRRDGAQQRLRRAAAHPCDHAAAFDVNTACTSFMYGLSIGSSMIKSGDRQERAGDRRRTHLPVHGLGQPQCRRAVRRRRRRHGA